jgi:lipopolysaccharide transport system permease protein
MAAEATPVLILRPSTGFLRLHLRDLWEYRELLYFLVWRDIKVRYKQTGLGAAWAILQPVMTMVVFSVFFGRLAKVPSDGVPYPIFAYCALLPWQLFAFALTESSNSLVASQNLITKVYFPRLVIPISSVLAGLVDFAIAFVILLVMMLYYGIVPTAAVALLPLFLLLAVMTALAVGLWLFATPVAYPSSLVPARWRPFYGLNPMAGVVEGFRWALLGKQHAPGPLLWVSVAAVIVLLIGGLRYFKKTESTFADIV